MSRDEFPWGKTHNEKTMHPLEGGSSGVLLNGEAMVPACATVQAAVELLQQDGQGAVPTLGQGVPHPEEAIHRL